MSGSWIEIDRKALESNVDAFRAVITPGCALMVVVKANAYGHGLEVVAPVVAKKADWLGVNSLEEALALEKLGIRLPVVILGHTPLEQLVTVVGHRFRQVVFRLDQLYALADAARHAGRDALVHIKIETGTNRLGVSTRDLKGFFRVLTGLSGLEVEGIYTHFANIEDTLDPAFAKLQLERFHEALQIAEKAGIQPRIVHSAATAGILLYPETHFSMVRLGIGTYGIWPSRETRIAARERGREISLEPALTWKTRVAQIKEVAAGDYVGYGLTYQATRKMKLAVIPTGYYDGYDRKLSNSGRALIHGRSVSVVGRVAMNMTMLDVTEADSAEDDEVVLLGRQEEAEITAEEIAEKTQTIPYEFLARTRGS